MIQNIMSNGFRALAAYVYIFAVITLILYIVASVTNAFMRNGKFDTAEIRKLFMTNLTFSTVFALLDYFLI
jgi:hypothetical protein